MPKNNLNEKIEEILKKLENELPTGWKDTVATDRLKNSISQSLKQFASDITESMLVEIEDIKIDPLREKREGVRGHIENLIKEAIKAKRDRLLNL